MEELDVLAQMLMGVLAIVAFGMIFGVVLWVLRSVALYSMAKRRGIQHAWLSWIPVGGDWILGSLSDQYQYVSQGLTRNKRKALLILSLILMVFTLITTGLSIATTFNAVTAGVNNYSDEQIMATVMGPMIGMYAMTLPAFGVSIAVLVIRYMALYNVYKSSNPNNAVLFLVLSIFFNVTEPFFLFFNRKSDAGMVKQTPPTYQAPAYLGTSQSGSSWDQAPQQNPQEPWNQAPQQDPQEPWNQNPQQ